MDKRKVKIVWFGKHFGEEPPLVGAKGAGTIFFCGCNLRCVFCQNWQISQNTPRPSGTPLNRGELFKEYSVEELAQTMIDLQKQGAANIDLVTPTPWRREIKRAIIIAKEKGLKIPIAWNSNGYESVAAIKDLEGLVDIFLPDFKYGDDKAAEKYSRAPKYFLVAEKAIREMYRQVGLLALDENGLAKKGLIIRHLILPNNLPNTFSALEKIAAIDKNIHLSLMSQYYPVYRAAEFPELNRQVSAEEFAAAENKKFELGLNYGWTQEPDAGETFLPDFTKSNPFI
ncbi:MAG TPA: radical SAM protein [Candidatus Nanoarchaeia archaeon]|nr:radical SAM protein [Candidatus Nanoarchaeia archaeon]